MKTMGIKVALRTLSLLSCMIAACMFTACSEDEEEVLNSSLLEPELSFTVGNTAYEVDFSANNAAIIATTNPNISWTSITLGGAAVSGETVSLVLAFQGKQTGTSTVSGAAGEDSNAPEGLSLGLVLNDSGQFRSERYDAVSVTVNVMTYREISGVTAEVEGTFSGTVVDVDGNQTNISGSFSTGNF
ncbi:MAG: hypothetical protein AAF616_06175 [Bacteroidota bacterium]